MLTDTPPSSLLDPKWVQLCGKAEVTGTWCRSQLPALKGGGAGGGEGRAESSGIKLGRGTLLIYSVLHPKPTTSWLETHSAPFWCWDKPWATLDSLDSPRPGLGGSHHLPPYSILCVAPPHPHPNDFYSRDSQGGVLRLSQFGLPKLWEVTTPGSNLGLEQGLKQTCSSTQELSSGVSHSFCTTRGRVDSQLFVVGSQTASLTTGLSFDHNLCCKCLNGPCEAIFDI
jgi:hypothetical protein